MDLPSLVVCGPQIPEISAEYLAWLRKTLLGDSRLEQFVRAIRDLPSLWCTLLETDQELETVPGLQLLQDLKRWIDDGTFPTGGLEPFPNIQATAMTVIIHIVEYMNYLKKLKPDSNHLHVLDGLRHGGVQGFCTGFLTATVLACSRDERDISELGAVAVRLAACIGAYVDLDSIFASPLREVVCLAGHWTTAAAGEQVLDILQRHPEAYISVRSGASSATFTVPKLAAPLLVRELSEHGIRTKQIRLKGRFHTPGHQISFQKLKRLCATTDSLRFPAATRPLVQLRRNRDGKVLTATLPLHISLLRCMLLEESDWNHCIQASADSLTASRIVGMHHVTVLGLVDCLPRSMRQHSGLKITQLRGPDIRQNYNANDGTVYEYPENAVAVVGMACRYSGADSLDEFWDVIRSGTSMLAEIPDGRVPKRGLRRDPKENFRFLGNFLRNADCFDQEFFKRSSREATSMDPQHRISLEVAYEALESSGYFSRKCPPTDIGCYLGVAASDYEDNVASHAPTAFSVTGTSRAFASGKISHFFGWNGPSIVFDTACSSSMVAIHTACKAVQTGECSMALAGGAHVITSPNLHQNLEAGNFLSQTGSSRAFDERADGYCRGEGVGLVLLKKLSSAIADNDNIVGVILGSAVNQNHGGFPITVPVSNSQTSLYKSVLDLAGMNARTVSYVEAHGTGTPKGDPIECASIRQVFGAQADRKLHFGSVKGNIGHTEAASGVAGLIKVLLMMQKQTIPPQAGFTSLNPSIPSLETDNMAITTTAQAWNVDFKAACVNNYGAAGSNAALIVSQAPANLSTVQKVQVLSSKYPILISARSPASLREYSIALRRRFLVQAPSMAQMSLLASTAFNLSQHQNRAFTNIATFSVATLAELDDCLKMCATDPNSLLRPKLKPVVLVFGGQTGDTIFLSEKIYHGCSLLQSYLDKCDVLLRGMGVKGLFPGIFKQDPVEDVVELHCMLFSLQYSCAACWIDSGLDVDTVIGHSFGQLTALCIAGVYSLPDALKLVSGRASLIKTLWGTETGCMLLVDSHLDVVQELLSKLRESGLGKFVDIACFNGPSSFVLVGADTAIHAFEEIAALHPRIRTKRLDVTHGFHSQFVDSIIADCLKLAQSISFKEPTIKVETCSKDESWSEFKAELVALQSREPVYFSEAVARIVQRCGPCSWVEAGSGSGVTSMVRRVFSASVASDHSFHSVKLGSAEALAALADTAADLWKAGVKAQYWPFHPKQRSSYATFNLPPYQFQKSRHWLDYVDKHGVAEAQEQPAAVETKPKLVSFVKYMDESRQVAEFSVNQRSEQYQTLVRGHAVLTSTLCPASLYIEMVASAAGFLTPNFSTSTTQNVGIKTLGMHAPLGIDLGRAIGLTLMSIGSAPGTWEFVLRSYQLNNPSSSTKHATGRISIYSSGSEEVTRRFSRFERLVDYTRCEALLAEPFAESMQGSVIYKMFNRVVIYSEIFRGMKKISTKQHEAAGLISMPEVNPELFAESVYNPLAVDSFTQVAGLHVNSLPDCDPNEVFVCVEIGDFESRQASQQSKSKSEQWLVYSNFKWSGDRDVVNDIFVYEAASKKLVLTIFGVRFSKVLTSSLSRALRRANSAERDSIPKPTVPAASQQLAASYQGMEPMKYVSGSNDIILQPGSMRQEATSVTSTSHEQIKLATKLLLHEVADLPIEDINEDASLEDLGIDSLMATELFSVIRERFNVQISTNELEEILDFKALYGYISTHKHGEPSYPASILGSNNEISAGNIPCTGAESRVGDPCLANDGMTTYAHQARKLSLLFAEHLDTSIRITTDTIFRDIGLDSLAGIELAADIEKTFGKHIDFACLDPECTFGILCDTVIPQEQALTPVAPKTNKNNVESATTEESYFDSTSKLENGASGNVLLVPKKIHCLAHAAADFASIRDKYNFFAKETGFADFMTKVYPQQAELVCAYLIDAFATLGCDLDLVTPGTAIPPVPHISKYRKLMRQFYQALEDAGFIENTGTSMIRTTKPTSRGTSQELHEKVLLAFPQHRDEHILLNRTGSNLAACLRGETDPLQLLFRDKAAKKLLEDVHTNCPMFMTGTRMLGAFLTQTFGKYQGSEPLRILEIGAGTGGTTKYILLQLMTLGVPFIYTFSDVSPSLVAAAKNKFRGYDCIHFMVLDVEGPPKENLMQSFDVVISSNCVHATKNLLNSTKNIYKLLRSDGFVCLLELTRNLSWLDCVFGLLDGWWLFEDGRQHVLADEYVWSETLLKAGFQQVDWSNDDTEESDQFRVITAFVTDGRTDTSSERERTKTKVRTKLSTMETMQFAEVDGIPLRADIYYPAQMDDSYQERPIALMIHGGGHVMLSRKDIRPKQTKLLLENNLLPVSIDYRLCPEVTLMEGPITDICTALTWARETLPLLRLQRPDIHPRGDKVVMIGWSTGGTLAMTLPFSAAQRSIKPPEAILAFYCPTDYESDFWRKPNFPEGVTPTGEESYDLLEAIQEHPITGYNVPASVPALGGWLSRTDPRSRIPLHMNWKGQTLPVLLNGLPSKKQLAAIGSSMERWHSLAQPTIERVQSVSPYAQIVKGNYKVPTFIIHGTKDDLIPWQHTQRTKDALTKQGVPSDIEIIPNAAHLFDLYRDPAGEYWKSILKGYNFLFSFVD